MDEITQSKRPLAKNQTWVDKLIRSSSGKVVIWQTPNFPLTTWAVLNLLSLIFSEGTFQNGLKLLATAFLFVWAYQEIQSGESLFRKILGAVVISAIIFSFFN